MPRGKTRCYRVKIGAGWGIIRGQLGEPCSCGCVAAALCDYPVGDGKTCDRKLCTDVPCAYEVAPDTHYCPDHFAEWKHFRETNGINRVLENILPFKGVA